MKRNLNNYLSNRVFGGIRQFRRFTLLVFFAFFAFNNSFGQANFNGSVYFDPVLNAYTVAPGAYVQPNTDIVISNNQTYVLNGVEILFGDCLEIRIEPGGKLICDNCVFEGGQVPNGWKGIRVLGPTSSARAGQLEIVNSTIRNAGIGILLGGTYFTNNTLYLDIAKAGGEIIRCVGNLFDQNNCGIIGLPATNNGNFWIQACTFTGFKATQPCLPLSRSDYYNSNTSSFQPIEGIRTKTQLNDHLDFIKIYGISDVVIEGCSFQSNLSTPTPESGFVKVCSEFVGSTKHSNRVNINHCTATGNIGTAFALSSVNEITFSTNQLDIVHDYTLNIPPNPHQSQGGSLFLDSCHSFNIEYNNFTSSVPDGLRFAIETDHSDGTTLNNRIDFNQSQPAAEAEGINYFYSSGTIQFNEVTSNQSQIGASFASNASIALEQNYPSNQSKGLVAVNEGGHALSISENKMTYLSEGMLVINLNTTTVMPIVFQCNKFYLGGAGVVVNNGISDQGNPATQTSTDNFWGFGVNTERNNAGDIYYFGNSTNCFNYFVNHNFNPVSFQPLNNLEAPSFFTNILSDEKFNNLKYSPSAKGWGAFSGANGLLTILPCDMGSNPEYINSQRKTSVKLSMQLYPNPASELVNISGVKVGDILYIYSIDGKLIRSVEITSDFSGELDVSTLINGMYLIKIFSNQEQSTTQLKFIKN